MSAKIYTLLTRLGPAPSFALHTHSAPQGRRGSSHFHAGGDVIRARTSRTNATLQAGEWRRSTFVKLANRTMGTHAPAAACPSWFHRGRTTLANTLSFGGIATHMMSNPHRLLAIVA